MTRKQQGGEETYPQAVLGYRMWYTGASGQRLLPFATGSYWHAGVNRASCLEAGESHQAPQQSCRCGFYAFHKLMSAWLKSFYRRQRTIVGAVAGAGRVYCHADGWRAEQAQVLALLNNPFNPHCRQLAKVYGVPLLKNRRQLKRFASQLAAPVPKNIRPSLPWYRNSIVCRRLFFASCVLITIHVFFNMITILAHPGLMPWTIMTQMVSMLFFLFTASLVVFNAGK